MELLTKDQNTIANLNQTESIVKRVLTSEVKYLIGILIFLFGVVAPYYDIKQEIALIKQNHLAHIETMQRSIDSNTSEIKDMKKIELDLMKEISAQNAKIIMLEK